MQTTNSHCESSSSSTSGAPVAMPPLAAFESPFRAAAALNNEAVTFMREGRMYGAVSLLEKSLHLCAKTLRRGNDEADLSPTIRARQAQQPHSCDRCSGATTQRTDEDTVMEGVESPSDDGSSSSTCPHGHCSHAVETSVDTLPVIPVRLDHLQSFLDKTNVSSADTLNFVDWRGLQVNPSFLEEDLLPRVLAWVLTYNMALSHHYIGLQPQQPEQTFSPQELVRLRQHALTRAVKSYGFVHQMMSEDPDLQGDVWMLLAVVNNLSRAQLSQGDVARGNFCTRRLLAILMYIQDHEEMNMPISLFEKYIANVEGLILMPVQTAPSA